MNDGLEKIAKPNLPVATASGVIHGPLIPPQQQLLIYEAGMWEGFVHEWAFYCLNEEYEDVQRFTGSGDRGLDIVGFADSKKLEGVWDNFQCKHYDHPLYPSDAWIELGKIVWHSFRKDYAVPRRYYFVSPQGAGTSLTALFANAANLRAGLLSNWDSHVANKLTAKGNVTLDAGLTKYIQQFDFSIFRALTSLQLVEAHRKTPAHAVRFGGGLKRRVDTVKMPPIVAASETQYVAKLMDAYADHKGVKVPDANALAAYPTLKNHFSRSREAFYRAESLRVFARDSVPEGTFELLQDDIYHGVIDIHDAPHSDGFARVCAVTKAARDMQITANALISCTDPKDRDGICHQLANRGPVTEPGERLPLTWKQS